jgi:hypothetical protein
MRARQRPGQGPTSDTADAIVVGLLPQEVDDPQVVVQSDATLAQSAHGLYGTNHPYYAVESAALGHGVGV